MNRFITFALLIFGNHAAAQQIAPNPNEVFIKRLTYSGSGCAAGTVRSDISTDAKAFTLIFDEYLAEIGPGVPNGKNKTKCKLTVDLRFPPGWSYTLFKVDYRGYINLDYGAYANQISKYYFQASPDKFVTFSSSFNGEMVRDYVFSDTIGLSDSVWSECGRVRALNVETELNVGSTNPNASGIITVDSIDGELTHLYGIKWNYCGN